VLLCFLGGNVKVSTLGTGALYTNAGVLTNTNPSSMEYKHDIKEIDLQGERLLGINLKCFVWNSDGTYVYGLIAEEVQQIVLSYTVMILQQLPRISFKPSTFILT
jgi:hypothetical protein